MKLGVIAGTVVDTQMGCDLIESYDYTSVFLPMSNTCNEQSESQYYSKIKLEELFIEKCKTAKEQGCEKIFLYCNSLSCSVDYNKISSELNIEIITPLESYKHLPTYCKNIVIMGANGLSAFMIDKIIREHNKGVNTICYGNVSIVESIEAKKTPIDIIKELNINGFIHYIENINSSKFKVDSILLGCTHFPYIKEEIEKITNLKIIDPTKDMLDRCKNN
ncbi:Asp/Glu/Hydantoin racemase [Peptoanaerobacter stomatis]|uniref:Asp/Glu/Hydantoin racemase n=1 Tax=Peptoanaerobacter stomatis TaxID=796937 RepID=J5WIB3_9FIRM|nr:aspartate/glutamate racemase family protein [Peptoanaerobacter stomatis]EJU22132.1 Asp/Glu/Hydantoin racemase [Peptoanaerobacter stomatis]NWO24949.1 aspartate/glutamate racemase family protein [Peptostreptococcaceae bacterium oral taxon 081]